MRNEEIKAELSALRAEVLALAEARKQSELRAVGQPEAPGAFEEHARQFAAVQQDIVRPFQGKPVGSADDLLQRVV